MRKTATQRYLERRIREVIDLGGERASSQRFQSLLELQRMRDVMVGAGEWVGTDDDDRPNSPEDIGGQGRPGGWTGGLTR